MLAQLAPSPSRARSRLLLLAALAALAIALAGFATGFDPPSSGQNASGIASAPPGGSWVSQTSSTRLPGTLGTISLPAQPPAPAVHAPVAPSIDAFAVNTSDAASAPVAAAPSAAASSSRQIVLVDPDSWDAASADAVDEALALLPASVQEQLGNPALGPVQISVNRDGRTPSGYQPYGRGANFFSTNESRNFVVLYPDQSALTVLHELGHAYNLRRAPAGNYASALLDPEMQSFMAATGWRVLTPASALASITDQASVSYAYDGAAIWDNLSHNDPLEDFANSFAWYFGNPQGLQSKAPERYTWFASHLGL